MTSPQGRFLSILCNVEPAAKDSFDSSGSAVLAPIGAGKITRLIGMPENKS